MDPVGDQPALYGLVQFKCTKQYTIRARYFGPGKGREAQGNPMPLFTVTMRSGRTATEKDAISAAIHEASVSAGYPEDDQFQRFISLEEADLRISPLYPDLQKPRSEHVLMIEALLSSGTEEDRKRSLLSAIVTRLQAAGTDPNDVMVFFGEIDRASSSFGGGRPALPVEVRPK
jgi:phenylpyruvate tautomerase PptA (4-oxalocrotonate tautomerase family)